MYKLALRNGVLEHKARFDKTQDRDSIIEAAIMYGIYTAAGGTAVIPLPPFVDNIYKVTMLLARIKLKCSEELTDAIFIKIKRQVEKLCVHLDYEDPGKINIIYNNIQISIDDTSSVSKLLSAISRVMLLSTNCLSRQQLDLISNLQNKYFTYIGRP